MCRVPRIEFPACMYSSTVHPCLYMPAIALPCLLPAPPLPLPTMTTPADRAPASAAQTQAPARAAIYLPESRATFPWSPSAPLPLCPAPCPARSAARASGGQAASRVSSCCWRCRPGKHGTAVIRCGRPSTHPHPVRYQGGQAARRKSTASLRHGLLLAPLCFGGARKQEFGSPQAGRVAAATCEVYMQFGGYGRLAVGDFLRLGRCSWEGGREAVAQNTAMAVGGLVTYLGTYLGR